MQKVYEYAVIGGGLYGLVALDKIVSNGAEAVLLEKDSEVGGRSRTLNIDGHQIERVASLFDESDKKFLEYLRTLGIDDHIVRSSKDHSKMFIYQNESLSTLPANLLEVFKSPILSPVAKARLLLGPLVSKCSADDVSAYDIFSKKYGEEYSKYIIDSLINEATGGNSKRTELSSLFRLANAKELDLSPLFFDSYKGVKLSLEGGMGEITTHLGAKHSERIMTSHDVYSVEKKGSIYKVSSREGSVLAKKVVFAISAPKVAGLTSKISEELSSNLTDICYSKMAVVTLSFNKADVSHTADGLGIYVPSCEGISTSMVRFLSTAFNNKAPSDKVSMQVYLGREDDFGILDKSDEEIVEVSLRDIRPALGITGKPVLTRVERFESFRPLYHVGHSASRDYIREELVKLKSIFLVGDYLEGPFLENILRDIEYKMKREDTTPEIVKKDIYLESFSDAVTERMNGILKKEAELLGEDNSLSEFASGHLYFGLHKLSDSWVFREWAPNAIKISLIGDFNDWTESEEYELKESDNGVWTINLAHSRIKHGDCYKLKIYWKGGEGERLPSYANYVVQDESTHLFSASVWNPEAKYSYINNNPQFDDAPLIYEAHVGMSAEEGKVNTYSDFTENVLPRIKEAGYNTIQLMAIQEHPYYGSFGYQVSNFFAACSRSGTPKELKRLIDTAHGLGIKVIMDIVHSHAVKNELEGLGNFDGTVHQYFHEGAKGEHPAWGTYCFDYSKNEVVHFLLSNVKYWMEEYRFDGFRFDGVTSMMYFHHGLEKAFTHYGDYFCDEVDSDAINYLGLANKLIKEINPHALSIAEDMSGLPGIAAPLKDGGLGFDYRLAMGTPDYWIKTLKEKRDEEWSVKEIWHELTNVRAGEGSISYVESHDQALVGDKTIIFRLVDKDMYTNMSIANRNGVVDRGLALHKMIRMITHISSKGGYLNFMGNEFGHPEWIDFPRKGNDWSYHYARRQWSLQDNEDLCFKFLSNFDKKMIQVSREGNLLHGHNVKEVWLHEEDKVIAVERDNHYFIFNFDAKQSYRDYMINFPAGEYEVLFHSDQIEFGGFENLPEPGYLYKTFNSGDSDKISLYLPARTILCLKKRNQ